MKAMLLSFLLLFVQQGMGPGPGTPASAASSCPFTDNFPGSGALSASWTTVSALGIGGGTIVKNSGVAQASAAFRSGGAVVTGGGCTFTANQYAQATVVAVGAGDKVEVLVRQDTSGNGYGLSSVGQLVKYTAGTSGFLTSGCGVAPAGTVMRITISGTTITGSYNGTTCATTTDSTYSTGSPGLIVNDGGTSVATDTQASTFSAN